MALRLPLAASVVANPVEASFVSVLLPPIPVESVEGANLVEASSVSVLLQRFPVESGCLQVEPSSSSVPPSYLPARPAALVTVRLRVAAEFLLGCGSVPVLD